MNLGGKLCQIYGYFRTFLVRLFAYLVVFVCGLPKKLLRSSLVLVGLLLAFCCASLPSSVSAYNGWTTITDVDSTYTEGKVPPKSSTNNQLLFTLDSNFTSSTTLYHPSFVFNSDIDFSKGNYVRLSYYVIGTVNSITNSSFTGFSPYFVTPSCPSSSYNNNLLVLDCSITALDVSSLTELNYIYQTIDSWDALKYFNETTRVFSSYRVELTMQVNSAGPRHELHPSGNWLSFQGNGSFPSQILVKFDTVSISETSPDPSVGAINGASDQAHKDSQAQIDNDNRIDQQHTDATNDSVNSSQSSGNSSQSDVSSSTTDLISVISTFIGSVSSASASNCIFHLDFGVFDLGQVDFCSLKPPLPFQIFSSLPVILVSVRLAFWIVQTIVNKFRSFTDG